MGRPERFGTAAATSSRPGIVESTTPTDVIMSVVTGLRSPSAMSSASAPATWGVDIDVPDIAAYPPPGIAETMLGQ